MKFKTKGLMVIQGGSIGSTAFTPNADIDATALLRIQTPAGTPPGGPVGVPGGGAATAGALMVLLSAPPVGPRNPESGHAASNLESWWPLFRSTDSLDLLGESGVMRVGINDLGWVVYDWAPGP